MRIDFAAATVVYMVHPQSRVIAFVQIDRSVGRTIEIEEADKSQVAEALGVATGWVHRSWQTTRAVDHRDREGLAVGEAKVTGSYA